MVQGQVVPESATGAPVVLRADKKRRKKRYSRGLRDMQTTNQGVARASRRLLRAVARGMARYVKESDRSARKKRDGALRDFSINAADALGVTLRASSGIPRDLADAFNTRAWRRSLRRSLKASARFNRRLLAAR